MYAPGYNGGGNDVYMNGVPLSKWYQQNPDQTPKSYYTADMVGDMQVGSIPHPIGPPVNQSQPNQQQPTQAQQPSILSSLPGALSPETTTAIQTYNPAYRRRQPVKRSPIASLPGRLSPATTGAIYPRVF